MRCSDTRSHCCTAPMAFRRASGTFAENRAADAGRRRPERAASARPSIWGCCSTCCRGSRSRAAAESILARARNVDRRCCNRVFMSAGRAANVQPRLPDEPERCYWVHGDSAPSYAAAAAWSWDRRPTRGGRSSASRKWTTRKSYLGVFRFLSCCAGGIVLVDAEELDAGVPRQAYAAMKILTYLGASGKVSGPTRVVQSVPATGRSGFSKVDLAVRAVFVDPAESSSARGPPACGSSASTVLLTIASSRPSKGACAGAEHPGGVGRVVVPLRIEPCGII